MNDGECTPIPWLHEPEGIGKSTVGFVILRQLHDAGTRVVYVDLDQLALCHPGHVG